MMVEPLIGEDIEVDPPRECSAAVDAWSRVESKMAGSGRIHLETGTVKIGTSRLRILLSWHVVNLGMRRYVMASDERVLIRPKELGASGAVSVEDRTSE